MRREFLISCEEFVKIVSSSCCYCGKTPAKANGMGVDRRNSAEGYISGNCVSCCSVCNYMKLDMSLEDFLEHVQLIHEHIDLRKGQ
jgi:hypothetical protein